MKNAGFIIVILALSAFVIYLYATKNNAQKRLSDALANASDKPAETPAVAESDNQDGDIKCELMDAYGRRITIIGRGPEFERLCLERRNQQQWLYGYYWWPVNYYTWYNPWGWRSWGGGWHHGRHPVGGHRSGTGGGTGGGGGTGTGAGTGTPGTGTP